MFSFSKQQTLDDENLSAVLNEMVGILNNRPLVPKSSSGITYLNLTLTNPSTLRFISGFLACPLFAEYIFTSWSKPTALPGSYAGGCASAYQLCKSDRSGCLSQFLLEQATRLWSLINTHYQPRPPHKTIELIWLLTCISGSPIKEQSCSVLIFSVLLAGRLAVWIPRSVSVWMPTQWSTWSVTFSCANTELGGSSPGHWVTSLSMC